MPWKHTLEEHYKEAVAIPYLVEQTRKTLGARNITPTNTLLANVTCRDELNASHVDDMTGFWGSSFNMCGLGGFPSAGLTGFAAYNAHVPDEGNMLIFFGPHIGINVDGDLGMIKREGMKDFSTACGALISLLDKVKADPTYTVEPDPYDAEQQMLESALIERTKVIASSANAIVELTEAAYEAIEARVREMIHKAEIKHQIVLLGGITVNLPLGEPDHFALRTSEILHCERNLGRTESWNPLA